MAERDNVDPLELRLGIRSADVWVLSDEPIATPLIGSHAAPRVRRLGGHLPSRAADGLFWFGRYAERAEAVTRLTLAHLRSFGDAVGHRHLRGPGRPRRPVDPRAARGMGLRRRRRPATAALAQEALCGRDQPGSARAHVASARRNAAALRARLSGEAWRVLADLSELLALDPGRTFTESQLATRAERTLSHLAALAGLAYENTSRAEGWHFAELGRRTERAINTCTFALSFASDEATPGCLGTMLALTDSQISYGRRYMQGAALDPVRDMVLLDPYNPRSIAFQVEAIVRHLGELPALTADGIPEPHCRLAGRILAELRAGEAADFDAVRLAALGHRPRTPRRRHRRPLLPDGPHAPRPEKLTGLA